MRLDPTERLILKAALDDHDHAVLGWDDPDDANTRRKSIAALLGKLAEPERAKGEGQRAKGGDGVARECECWPTFGDNDTPAPAGICIRDESNGIYVMRCDQCSIFSTDAAAADFLASILGDVPWQKDFVEPMSDEERAFATAEKLLEADSVERRYEPFFPMSLDEFYRYLTGYYNAMESRCYKALKLPLPQRREPPKLGTLSAAMHEQFKSFEEATAALKADTDAAKREALKRAVDQLANRDATIEKLHAELQAWHDKAAEANVKHADGFNLAGFVKDGDDEPFADHSHGSAPTTVRVEETSALAKEGLRGALVLLRNAIDEAEIADHVPSEILSVVDLIIEKTEA